MRIEETTLKATTAILLAEVKEHLRIDGSAEDSKLNAITATAECMIEAAVGLTLISRDFDVYLNVSPVRGKSCLSIPVRPLQTINMVNLIAADGSETLWLSSNYNVQPGLMPLIDLSPQMQWPKSLRSTEGMRINVTAGFGSDWNAIPADIHQALLLLITALYFNRGDTVQTGDLLKSSGAMAILLPYRQVRL